VVNLAIIIVNYNTCEDLRNCLCSIRASEGELSYEVVVVDNCSSDGSVDMVRSEHPWVQQVIASEHNGGYAYANNLGLRAVGYDAQTPLDSLPSYVLLLNPDTVLPEAALAEMVAFMDAHEDIGVAGPKLLRGRRHRRLYAHALRGPGASGPARRGVLYVRRGP